MNVIAGFLVFLVAVIHVGFAVLEMFLWTGPVGQRIFNQSPEFMNTTAVLAANQGLYNLLLAGGLAWAAWSGRLGHGHGHGHSHGRLGHGHGHGHGHSHGRLGHVGRHERSSRC